MSLKDIIRLFIFYTNAYMIIVLYESVFKNKIFCSDFDAALNIWAYVHRNLVWLIQCLKYEEKPLNVWHWETPQHAVQWVVK